MTVEEGLKISVNWDKLKELDDSEDILKDIISCFQWIKEKDITQEEMIIYINRRPLHAEVVEYGIHGLMVSMKLDDFYWNMFTLKDFEPLLDRRY